MAKKEDRFEVVFQDGSQMKDSGVRQILADKETGVHYLVWKAGYAGGHHPAAGFGGECGHHEIMGKKHPFA